MENKGIDRERLETIVEGLKTLEKRQAFPPVGDAHSLATYTIFGEKTKDAFYGNKVETHKLIEVNGEMQPETLEGKDAKIYFDKYLRKQGKVAHLAMVYGATGYTVANRTGVTEREGETIVSNFMSGNPHISRYLDNNKASAFKNKQVKALLGRIRYLPEIDSSNPKVKGYNKRLAMNAPIQTSGSDQLKLMMIEADKFCETYRLNRISGNLINTYKGWYTRVIAIIGEDRLPEISERLDAIENGNCKVVVFASVDDFNNEKISYSYDRNLRLTMKDIKEMGMTVIW